MSTSRLEQLAYRMLGSVADAQDVVQEAELRLLRQEASPDDKPAWMFRVVTNIALDKLREQKRQRENYTGPWLPEPLQTASENPDTILELAEGLSLGMMFMLERLSPAERVVFVLREGFDLSYSDIAALVGVAESACRQRHHRARASLAGERSYNASMKIQRALLEQLLEALASRDLRAIADLFADDAVVYTDGGGVVNAAIHPITDPERIARVALHLTGNAEEAGGFEYQWRELNGGVGLLITQAGELHSTLQLEVSDGRITRLFVMRNPDKLAHLRFEGGQ